ncbi:MAG: shikimate kinase [Sphingobacteriales bacterium]|nr:MAG: shikimate kinase [Sphingobacteriales bacterium]
MDKSTNKKKEKPAHGNRIFLVGFMGAGKTSVGRLLASMLGYQFVDTDTLVEQAEGRSVSEIFREHGEGYFREIEAVCLRNGVIPSGNIIIATGGGTPCFHLNMKWMKEQGTTIMLHTPPHVLTNRLFVLMAHRPLIAGFNKKKQLLTYVENQLVMRHYYYDQADYIVYCKKKEVFSVAQDLKVLIERIYSKDQ